MAIATRLETSALRGARSIGGLILIASSRKEGRRADSLAAVAVSRHVPEAPEGPLQARIRGFQPEVPPLARAVLMALSISEFAARSRSRRPPANLNGAPQSRRKFAVDLRMPWEPFRLLKLAYHLGGCWEDVAAVRGGLIPG